MGVGAAVAVAGVSAAAGLAGSAMQAGAVGSASKASIAAQERARDQARADLQPWTATGGQANTQTANLLGLNGQEAADAAMKTFQTSPGYQFQLEQGLGAVDAGAAGKGLLRSGATLKAEQAYGSGLADQEFGNYYNRLFGLSQLGQKSAAGQGADSMEAGKGIANTEMTQGAQMASIYGNAAKGISDIGNTYANNSLYADRTAAIGSGKSIGDPLTPSYSGQPSPYGPR